MKRYTVNFILKFIINVKMGMLKDIFSIVIVAVIVSILSPDLLMADCVHNLWTENGKTLKEIELTVADSTSQELACIPITSHPSIFNKLLQKRVLSSFLEGELRSSNYCNFLMFYISSLYIFQKKII